MLTCALVCCPGAALPRAMLQNRRDEIIAILQDAFDVLMGRELPVVRNFDDKLVATVVKTKKEAKARSNSATSAAETQKVRRHSQVRLRLRSHSALFGGLLHFLPVFVGAG